MCQHVPSRDSSDCILCKNLLESKPKHNNAELTLAQTVLRFTTTGLTFHSEEGQALFNKMGEMAAQIEQDRQETRTITRVLTYTGTLPAVVKQLANRNLKESRTFSTSLGEVTITETFSEG